MVLVAVRPHGLYTLYGAKRQARYRGSESTSGCTDVSRFKIDETGHLPESVPRFACPDAWRVLRLDRRLILAFLTREVVDNGRARARRLIMVVRDRSLGMSAVHDGDRSLTMPRNRVTMERLVNSILAVGRVQLAALVLWAAALCGPRVATAQATESSTPSTIAPLLVAVSAGQWERALAFEFELQASLAKIRHDNPKIMWAKLTAQRTRERLSGFGRIPSASSWADLLANQNERALIELADFLMHLHERDIMETRPFPGARISLFNAGPDSVNGTFVRLRYRTALDAPIRGATTLREVVLRVYTEARSGFFSGFDVVEQSPVLWGNSGVLVTGLTLRAGSGGSVEIEPTIVNAAERATLGVKCEPKLLSQTDASDSRVELAKLTPPVSTSRGAVDMRCVLVARDLLRTDVVEFGVPALSAQGVSEICWVRDGWPSRSAAPNGDSIMSSASRASWGKTPARSHGCWIN